MTPALFSKIGEALYGPSWRAALADKLGVSEKSVRRWANGIYRIPEELPAELSKLCREHSEKLATIADQLSR